MRNIMRLDRERISSNAEARRRGAFSGRNTGIGTIVIALVAIIGKG
jgi:hypothetical protein